jgi:hypothetical protein
MTVRTNSRHWMLAFMSKRLVSGNVTASILRGDEARRIAVNMPSCRSWCALLIHHRFRSELFDTDLTKRPASKCADLKGALVRAEPSPNK